MALLKRAFLKLVIWLQIRCLLKDATEKSVEIIPAPIVIPCLICEVPAVPLSTRLFKLQSTSCCLITDTQASFLWPQPLHCKDWFVLYLWWWIEWYHSSLWSRAICFCWHNLLSKYRYWLYFTIKSLEGLRCLDREERNCSFHAFKLFSTFPLNAHVATCQHIRQNRCRLEDG